MFFSSSMDSPSRATGVERVYHGFFRRAESGLLCALSPRIRNFRANAARSSQRRVFRAVRLLFASSVLAQHPALPKSSTAFDHDFEMSVADLRPPRADLDSSRDHQLAAQPPHSPRVEWPHR